MKALLRYENGIQNFCEVKEPQITRPDQVKIKVKYSTIGIQDLRMSRDWDFYSKTGIAGYEMSGVIVELGDEAKRQNYFIGQHVTGTIAQFCGSCPYCLRGEENNCLKPEANNGTICEYVVWDVSQLLPVKQNVPFAISCLTEPVAVVNMAAQKMHIASGDSVCIFGGDFNGLLLVQFAKHAGAKTIIVVEPKEQNQRLAMSFGATKVISPSVEAYETELLKLTDFIGYQKVAVTSSNPEYFDGAIRIAARGGLLMLTVYFDIDRSLSINSIQFFTMNIQIASSFLYTRKVLRDTVDLMDKLRLRELIFEEYSVKDALMAFESERKNKYPRIGLILD